jgi:hypothetical protein
MSIAEGLLDYAVTHESLLWLSAAAEQVQHEIKADPNKDDTNVWEYKTTTLFDNELNYFIDGSMLQLNNISNNQRWFIAYCAGKEILYQLHHSRYEGISELTGTRMAILLIIFLDVLQLYLKNENVTKGVNQRFKPPE